MSARVNRSGRAWAAVVVAGLLLFPSAGLAVAGQQEAGIIGVVVDESGGVLPGVTVTATGPALQVPSVIAVTNERGEYRLTPLPLGTYAVVFSLTGFQTARREGIVLPVGFVAKIDIPLKVGSLEETVLVSGASPVVDVVSTASSTVLTRATLDILPSGRNGTVAFMAQAPGVRPQIDNGGSTMANPPTFRAFGQDNQPWQTMEGVLVSAAKNGAQGGIYWDYTMVDEARVATFGSPAEVGTRGVVINGIVKSGGNDFHGTGFFAYQGKNLQSSNIDDDLRAQGITVGDELDSRTDTSGDIGGRIVRNKLWFYGGARRRTQRSNTLACFQPNGEQCYGFDYQIFNTQKVSWQINASDRLVGFQNYARKTTGQSGTRLLAWESRYGQQLPSHIEKVEWQSVRGNSLMITAMAGDMHWHAWFRGYGFGKVLKTDSVLGTTTGMSGSDGDDPDDYNHQPFRGSMTWYKPDLFLGHHDIKVGGDYMARRSDRTRPTRAETWHKAQEILEGDVPSGYDSGNYQLQFLNGVANRLIAFNYPAIPYNLEHLTNVYLQDSWRAGRLTLNLGVRYAHDNGFAPPQCHDASPPPGDVAFPAQCYDKVQMKIFDSLVPRLHAAYDLTGDGKTVVKGGWGRFMLMRYTDQTAHANWNVEGSMTYIWRDLNGNGDYDKGEVNLDPNGPDYVSTNARNGAGTSFGVPNPNEKQSGTDEFSVSAERELMANLAVRVTGIYSRTFNFAGLLNNKRPYEAYNIPITNPDPGPDNIVGTADDTGTRITYYDFPVAFAGARNQEPMLVTDSRAKNSYTSAEFAIVRRLANRWHLSAAYSFTQTHVSIIPNAGGGIDVATIDPNSEINSADNTKEWLGKYSGSYVFPFDVTASLNIEQRSGLPQKRTAIFRGGRQIAQITLPVEQLGEKWWLPDITLVDLNVQKTLSLKGGRSATLRMNVFNLLNANTMTGRNMTSGPNFGLTTGILLPRLAEAAVSFRF